MLRAGPGAGDGRTKAGAKHLSGDRQGRVRFVVSHAASVGGTLKFSRGYDAGSARGVRPRQRPFANIGDDFAVVLRPRAEGGTRTQSNFEELFEGTETCCELLHRLATTKRGPHVLVTALVVETIVRPAQCYHQFLLPPGRTSQARICLMVRACCGPIDEARDRGSRPVGSSANTAHGEEVRRRVSSSWVRWFIETTPDGISSKEILAADGSNVGSRGMARRWQAEDSGA